MFLNLSAPPVLAAGRRPSGKRTPWIHSWNPPGILTASAAPTQIRECSTKKRFATGCPWTSVLAGGVVKKCGGTVRVGRTEKMSKSKKNVVEPDSLIQKYGADTVRLFCLFAAPPEKDLEWGEQGVGGGSRFLSRVWRLVDDQAGISAKAEWPGKDWDLPGDLRALRRKTHGTIKKVTEDIENRFHFNTAISAIMELVNVLYLNEEKLKGNDPYTSGVLREALESLVVLLSPMVPHIGEALWETLGHAESIGQVPWPAYDLEALKDEDVLIVIQVNGKLRGRITVGAHASEDEVKEAVLNNQRGRDFINKQPARSV